ncbi:hypothetical protein VCHENC01_0996 [Vibrio harveyi]|uniref:DUF3466 family protein n=1 Tax=Vibrio harveyi TaxID=669 RepID=UPI00028C1162|nr:DUF3466 family protein [Vibrio harveyi]EKM14519.1 hypothetical protein VCHENC01_0996 [Vibrio harveyi]
MSLKANIKFIALATAGFSISSQAALYQVVQVVPDNTNLSSFGSAIQSGDINDPITGQPYSLGCFEKEANCDASKFKMALDVRSTAMLEGKPIDVSELREEVPFAMDSSFAYRGSESGFKRYCDNEKKYKICSAWASTLWQAWSLGHNEASEPTVTAYVEGDHNTAFPLFNPNTKNSVVNALTKDAKSIGTVATGLDSKDTISPVKPNFTTAGDQAAIVATRAWATDGAITVGSVARKSGSNHSSKAAIWDDKGNALELEWQSKRLKGGKRLAQGSMRDFVTDGSTVYGVGYNSYQKDNYMDATVFVGDLNKKEDWVNKPVDGAQQRIKNKTLHSNSRLTGVNSNFVAIGEAKRSGQYLMPTGSAPNRLFVVNDVRAKTLRANYLQSGIFFDGASGKMGAINTYNEIVGRVDAEKVRASKGKPRRQRAFILPYAKNSKVSERAKTLFDGKAWYLDDLTNGSDSSDTSSTSYSQENNRFRIIDASDINDAGIISATALKCHSGYKTTANNATCSDKEEVVAVKLIPIKGKTAKNIVPRDVEKTPTKRNGAGLGLFTAFGLIILSITRNVKTRKINIK